MRITVTVPEEVAKEAHDYVMSELAAAVQLNGFSKKRAPPASILINYVGQLEVRNALSERLLTSTIAEALKGVADRAYKDSEQIETPPDDMRQFWKGAKLLPSGDLTYAVLVDVMPEVQFLQPYTGQTIDVVVPTSDEYDVEMVEAMVQKRLRELATLRVAFGVGLVEGDVAVFDMEQKRVSEEGAAADALLGKQEAFQLDTLGGAETLPGLLDNILGMQTNEVRTFELDFPQDWPHPELRGVRCEFTLTLKELFNRDMPELEDSIAGQLLPGCSTVAEVREELLTQQKAKSDAAYKEAESMALLDAIADCVKVEVPESLIKEQGYQMYGAKLMQAQAEGNISAEAMEQLTTEVLMDNYCKANASLIERTVRKTLTCDAIFRKEGLTVPEEELAAEVQNAVAEFERYGQDYDLEKVREQALEVLEATKVLDYLKANSDLTYTFDPPPVRIGM